VRNAGRCRDGTGTDRFCYTSALALITRREFATQCATAGAGALVSPVFATNSAPGLQFPSRVRERIAIATYPFREFISAKEHKSGNPIIELKDFAAHVIEKFNVNKIEPWTGHFPSTDPKYLDAFRTALQKAGGVVVNLAVDGTHSPYALDSAERQKAIDFSKQWIDAAAAIGSISVRTNLPAAKDSEPDLARTADTLSRVVEYAASKNVVVNLENDNPVSEDPSFLVKLIDKVNNPWLHALPDFCNTLAAKGPERGYSGIDTMFAKAYNICHVKAMGQARNGELVRVDMAKTFLFLKQHAYKGYCSMEFDSPGDPYQGTADLIETTLKYLA
jgi:sugar phosphate isomerase/epimerase